MASSLLDVDSRETTSGGKSSHDWYTSDVRSDACAADRVTDDVTSRGISHVIVSGPPATSGEIKEEGRRRQMTPYQDRLGPVTPEHRLPGRWAS